MSDMIRLFVGDIEFKTADRVFKRQTSGTATMQEAFETAGPLTQSLTMRQALGYVKKQMKFVNGFHKKFVPFLQKRRVPLIVNSTGYSVTVYAIRECFRLQDVIHGQIGNTLHFNLEGVAGEKSLSGAHEDGQAWFKSFEGFAKQYFSGEISALYDNVKATGEITLSIENEDAKASLLATLLVADFPETTPDRVVHIGDTYGDFGGIVGVARAGGHGIAFNYNDVLETRLREVMATEPGLKDRIHFVDPKGQRSNMDHVVSLLSSLF